MTIKHLVTGALALAAFVTVQPGAARAGDYCREYTRTVYVGGKPQEAYGTACLQPDGSWMIVGEGLENNPSSNASDVTYVIHDERRDVVPARVVYYERPIETYRYRPTPLFVWYSHDRHGRYQYNRHGRYDTHRNDRWDDDDLGHGRGRP